MHVMLMWSGWDPGEGSSAPLFSTAKIGERQKQQQHTFHNDESMDEDAFEPSGEEVLFRGVGKSNFLAENPLILMLHDDDGADEKAEAF